MHIILGVISKNTASLRKYVPNQESLFDVPFEPVKTVQPTPEEVEIAAAEWHEFHKVLDLEGTCDICKTQKAWRMYKEKKICEHCYLKAIHHWSVK